MLVKMCIFGSKEAHFLGESCCIMTSHPRGLFIQRNLASGLKKLIFYQKTDNHMLLKGDSMTVSNIVISGRLVSQSL